MPTARVAVIIPVYNREESILRAVDSVVQQSFADFELLVVDDGSTDRTVATVASNCRDPRLRILRHSTNQGAAAARNTAIRATQAEFVAFLDSDDEWVADKLERQIDYLKTAQPDVLMCCTGYWSVRMRSNEVLTRVPRVGKSWRHTLHGGCNLSPGSTALVRRQAFEMHGLFDERLRRLEDWDWLLRYTAQHDLIVMREPLARIHVSERMVAAPVDDAADIMRAKYGAMMRQIGYGTSARFRAALLIEQAATSFYAGRPVRAIAYLGASLMLYPMKPIAFFPRLLRRAWRLLTFRVAEDRQAHRAVSGGRGREGAFPRREGAPRIMTSAHPGKPEG
jgi:glycosyltransferase involved in cell wall biosynthesis